MSPDIPGLLASLGLNTDTYQVTRGCTFRDRWFPGTDVALPLVIQDIDDTALSWLQNCLPRAYPPHHTLYWVNPAHTESDPQTRTIADLTACCKVQPDTLLIVPPLDASGSVNELVNIVARLRAPGGCPWDQEQTLASLRSDVLSEAYEACEAIDLGDHDNLQEELGDLLMGILFLIDIAADEGLFQLSGVLEGICQKMIRRHPHVYGDRDAEDSTTVMVQWEEIKQAEYAAKGKTRQLLDGIPASLPALETARQLQAKASRAGHDTWLHVDADTDPATDQLAEDHLGRQLWELVSQARQHDLNPEDALRKYNTLFRVQVKAAVSQANRAAETRIPKREKDGEPAV